ncbi:MAG: O-antigen polymerase [bacterium]
MFGKNKFSPVSLLISLWLVAIGISQLRLSPYELPFSFQFWLVLIGFLLIFYFSSLESSKWWDKIKEKKENYYTSDNFVFIILFLMTLACLASNIYIYLKFGTLPILSSEPDKLRFIINKQVFGVWEYLALLPRIFIPISFFIYLQNKKLKPINKNLLIANIIVGFLILFLYAARSNVVFAVLLCYFSYLILNIKTANAKKVIIASLVAGLVVLFVAVSVPAFRHYVTYRKDYLSDIDYNPFTYLANLSGIHLPAWLSWSLPLYLIPSFNLQALMRSLNFFNSNNFFYGLYDLSVFNPLIKIFHVSNISANMNWEAMFLPWWVTATFLFSYQADFGLLGILLAAILWGVGFSGIYVWAKKRPAFLPVMLLSYFSFVSIMSIYTNYLMRPEFYMDMALLIFLGFFL